MHVSTSYTTNEHPSPLPMSFTVRVCTWRSLDVVSCLPFCSRAQATAPQNVRGSVLTYSSEQLLVHLDDQDERMQRAVFAVLEASY